VAQARAPARRPRVVGIVDDDAGVRDSLCFLLEIAGFRVLAYASAAAFLADSARGDVDCLLVDQHMPHCTGLELLDQLQRRAERIPAALITGSPSANLRERAAQVNVAHVWEKPLAEAAVLAFAAGEEAGPD
jgi:FixJ family two-component response regulator